MSTQVKGIHKALGFGMSCPAAAGAGAKDYSLTSDRIPPRSKIKPGAVQAVVIRELGAHTILAIGRGFVVARSNVPCATASSIEEAQKVALAAFYGEVHDENKRLLGLM